jgi:hypothetical protein
MNIRLASRFRANAVVYLALAADCRLLARVTDNPRRRRERIIDAKHYLTEAADLAAAAAHSGWRLP